LLEYLYILVTSPTTHCRIISFKKLKNNFKYNFFKIKKYFVDVDVPSCVCKMVEIHHNGFFNYIINIYLKFSKKLDKVYSDLKD
jgi:hypothetical protein